MNTGYLNDYSSKEDKLGTLQEQFPSRSVPPEPRWGISAAVVASAKPQSLPAWQLEG